MRNKSATQQNLHVLSAIKLTESVDSAAQSVHNATPTSLNQLNGLLRYKSPKKEKEISGQNANNLCNKDNHAGCGDSPGVPSAPLSTSPGA